MLEVLSASLINWDFLTMTKRKSTGMLSDHLLDLSVLLLTIARILTTILMVASGTLLETSSGEKISTTALLIGLLVISMVALLRNCKLKLLINLLPNSMPNALPIKNDIMFIYEALTQAFKFLMSFQFQNQSKSGLSIIRNVPVMR